MFLNVIQDWIIGKNCQNYFQFFTNKVKIVQMDCFLDKRKNAQI